MPSQQQPCEVKFLQSVQSEGVSAGEPKMRRAVLASQDHSTTTCGGEVHMGKVPLRHNQQDSRLLVRGSIDPVQSAPQCMRRDYLRRS